MSLPPGRGAFEGDRPLGSVAYLMPDTDGPYVGMVDENSHYMDESERYENGRYADYAGALAACKAIVGRVPRDERRGDAGRTSATTRSSCPTMPKSASRP